MGKRHPAKASANGRNGSLRISYAGIGATVGLLAVVSTVWSVGSKLATKADVEAIRTTLAPTINTHESRIRDLELQMASHFGASPTVAPRLGDTLSIPTRAALLLAQYLPSQSLPSPARIPPQAFQRRIVVPVELVKDYNLEPSQGGSYALLGEDGRYYSLDDVLAVIIRIHLAENKSPALQQRR